MRSISNDLKVTTMSNKTITPVAAIVGAALAGGLTAAQAASTDLSADQLFGATELGSGYVQIAGKEGSCGEGKCGEGKCGDKGEEGEGKCGEGKCGGDKG
jgi:uncharacterized low-complexity protein